ncbi:hypothetical protein CBP36_20500 (plasmid) [Acidovorax carolinensis]|uniref:HTH merR-type domain-containing protein n=1 Tax=Acidovorax carolinensis TaxID=553814 RepID=A0A240UJR3_9BURK|nr:MerR family transcriptional regulator [Acidovorax carolinensis]ART57312.1 hypothetical protein CBP35_20580 [Acidovorax carolinensis]ART61355.1 hypothetical protein CBP36_20500 [Acidovorax carolinensis]
MVRSDMPQLPIRHLVERFGLPPSAIHFYEQMGLLSPAQRSRSGHRRYGAAEIRRLELIVAARELGCSVAEIGRLIALHAATDAEQSTPGLTEHRQLLRRKGEALRMLKHALTSQKAPSTRTTTVGRGSLCP